MKAKTHAYKLTWSPEGRNLGTVQATSARQAKRLAPLPYRKYLGEISVEVLNPSSYIAVISAEYGSLLLGGVSRIVSSRFETDQMARDYISACLDANRTAGHKVLTWEVIGSDKTAEVKEN